MNWKEFRRRVLERYEKAEIDREIKYVLDIINSSDCYVTLSSCAGRIVIMDMPVFGDKKNSIFLGKWHSFPKLRDIKRCVAMGKMQTWFMMHPPIIHIACEDLDNALKLLEVAKEAGFRRSGIISQKKFAIEISSQERVEMLVAENGEILIGDKALKRNLEISIEKLKRARERIFRFSEIFKKRFLG